MRKDELDKIGLEFLEKFYLEALNQNNIIPDEPLILDQPEDDLDNQLIYDLIVSQLRAAKQYRQVILVIHNANIVVNGDSENVISLDVINRQTQIKSQGSLQESFVREDICNIMEGGKEAFEQRYKRIYSTI